FSSQLTSETANWKRTCLLLSPFLFPSTPQTSGSVSQSCHLQKFSDDSAIVGCISRGQEEEYRSVVDRFCGVVWTEPPAAQCHKDKGVADAIYKKGQSRLFFLRRTQIFQHLQDHAADVLSLGGIQRHLLTL
ncbi:hypothetical protein L3Q82_026437, partial [Scortum barcoo]